MRPRSIALLIVALAGFLSESTQAQSVRGVVVDGADRPVAGVVIQLLDSAGTSVNRALSAASGEFRLTARRAGTYHLRSLRIGYRPTVTPSFVLAADEVRTERLRLTGIILALDTMRVSSTNSCGGSRDAAAATFAALEQARAALLATELTGASRGVTVTTLDYDRSLDAGGRRVLRQQSALRRQTVRQPWIAFAPESLHQVGYVRRDASDSTTYYAPGLDMLGSDLFVADHCFELRRDGALLGVIFEPTRERRSLPEIRGTMWLDVATSNLQALQFEYVNLSSELPASSGAELKFVRLPTGGWFIRQWRIRMPELERRFASQALGGSGLHVKDFNEQGGELILAVSDRDTLWSQPPRVLTGEVVDSTSGRVIPSARILVTGLGISAVADDRGRYELRGLLPGAYGIEIRTASLDSVGGRYEVIVEFKEEPFVRLRVPTSAEFMRGVCGDVGAALQAGVFGRVTAAGGARIPLDTRVAVEWHDPLLRAEGKDVVVSQNRQVRRARPDSAGAYRICGVPGSTQLSVVVESDSGSASYVPLRLTDATRFARADFVMERGTAAFASLSGVVQRDSTHLPVAGADVSIADIGFSTTTDARGAFQISGIAPGDHHVMVRKLGLTALDTVLTFTRGGTTRHNVTLKTTQVLKPVLTRAMMLPSSFEEHRLLGLGTSRTREELDKMEGRTLAAVIIEMRGSHVVQGGMGSHSWMSSSRRQDCRRGLEKTCPPDTYFPDQPEVNRGVMSRCYSKVYLDNVLMNPGKPTPPFDVNELRVPELEAIEYFAGASEVPNEYSGLNTTCGVLVLHRRRSP